MESVRYKWRVIAIDISFPGSDFAWSAFALYFLFSIYTSLSSSLEETICSLVP